MKVVFLLFLSGSVAFAQKDCIPYHDLPHEKCDEYSMSCYGGEDANGCTMPDFCAPSKGTLNKGPGHVPG